MKKISVIIPCYNVEKYIERCIRSLVRQSIGVKELEIIFVDDASTDDTISRLMVWERRFPESILIIRCAENGRQGRARNIGIEYATAPYICFIDADDWVEINMLAEMYEVIERTQVDIVVGQSGRDIGDGRIIFNFDEFIDCRNRILRVEDYEHRKRLLLYGVGAGVWGKLYRTDFIKKNHIDFLEKTAYEDNYFGALVSALVSSYYVLDGIYYHYFANMSSTITERNSKRHIERLQVEIKTVDKLYSLGFDKEYHDEIENRFLRLYYINSLYLIFDRFDKLPYDILEEMRKEVIKRFPNYKSSKYYEEFSEFEKGLLSTLEVEMSKNLWYQLAIECRKYIN